ncbi:MULTISPECIES: ferritin [Methanohalophilus]|jgi:ferritin|uniref:Ferritin n=1 Tax=Methanohalophilus euhalobius TaxID=51203 RepID=A0A285FT25_9EURY|nr:MULTISPECIES: ferritin [Methanohalophilus]KXS46029.1 MAG: ferritin [Methanohalophilus sp. T328-1]RSD33333.1 MAG: ferritin [Methanohalophilus sp.]OBZ34401.1 MAG: ferritin [Methanohalophilus sp. DAL1]ODV49777.1 MAG: ferritin [Methanohalophilus sp. 2-GBenrich]PQV42470.1 ferritin [Methanohalophilus euhalobius]
MLSEKMIDALNEQINREMYSAYLYMAMSAASSYKGLDGFSNWFMVQYQEEMTHAMRIYDYLNGQGAQIQLKAIEQPPKEFGTPLEMFKATLEHEQFITRSINELVTLANEEKDYATNIFLQWFVTEQVEEESNDNEIISKLQLAGEDGNGLFMIDKELGARVFTPPAQEEQ